MLRCRKAWAPSQLFTDNIPMPLEIRGDKLFVVK